LCIALRDHDEEAWLDFDQSTREAEVASYRAYHRVCDAMFAAGRRYAPAPVVVVENWPQVLADDERAGLIAQEVRA
jgi:hypothetical protein